VDYEYKTGDGSITIRNVDIDSLEPTVIKLRKRMAP